MAAAPRFPAARLSTCTAGDAAEPRAEPPPPRSAPQRPAPPHLGRPHPHRRRRRRIPPLPGLRPPAAAIGCGATDVPPLARYHWLPADDVMLECGDEAARGWPRPASPRSFGPRVRIPAAPPGGPAPHRTAAPLPLLSVPQLSALHPTAGGRGSRKGPVGAATHSRQPQQHAGSAANHSSPYQIYYFQWH